MILDKGIIKKYDYNLDIEVQREEAMEDGIQIGEEPTMIQRIYDVAKKYAPDYDAEKICAELL